MHPVDAPESRIAHESVLAFVDVLGFATLAEAHELDHDALLLSDRLLSPSLTYEMIVRLQKNSLTRIFSGFHQTLKAALQIAQMRHPVTAITFSDSAFIAARSLSEIANLAADIVSSLLAQGIPVRVGIAHGSFAALRFRSDIAADGGDHAAHFLGTAVVRAHAAESCGIKGMRILLHPSAHDLLSDPIHNPTSGDLRVIPCTTDERNKVGVNWEVDYWRLRPSREKAAWHALQDMWATAPESEHLHYQATAEAINRMRVSRGAVPLKRLRCRTLPRDAQR